MHTPDIPIYIDKSIILVTGCESVFPDFGVFISLPLVVSLFTAELSAIFLALSRIYFVIYSDFQAATLLGTRNPLTKERLQLSQLIAAELQ